MTSFTMGVTAAEMTVRLPPDADFISTLETIDGSDWSDTVSAELRFPDGTVWPATRTGSELVWDVDKAAVNDLLEGSTSPLTVTLFYIDGDRDVRWAKGTVDKS